MSRARNIKPGFFKNEVLAQLPFEARLLFIGLWTEADRDGRLEDRPVRLKMTLFPADHVDVDGCLQMLHDGGLIHRYESGGSRYIQVVEFAKHQNPHVKEAASCIPPPVQNHTCTMQAPCGHGSSRADSLIPDSLIPYQQLSDQQTPLILTDPPAGEQDGAGTKRKARRRRQGEPTGDALCDIVIDAYESILCAPERKGKCLRVSTLTPKRKKRIVEADKMAKGFCEREGLPYVASDFWPRYFQECMLFPWMRGDVPNPNNADWKPHLGLLIDEDRFTQVMDKVVTRQEV